VQGGIKVKERRCMKLNKDSKFRTKHYYDSHLSANEMRLQDYEVQFALFV